MILRKGNMWYGYGKVDLFLITTNAYIKNNWELTMGAGIAKQAAHRFPKLPKILGEEVYLKYGQLSEYNLLISKDWPEKTLGCFQTKRYWSDGCQYKYN